MQGFSLPLKYLGLLLGVVSRGVAIWDLVIEKIECRLAGWKRLYQSKGGKTALIKSTLSNLLMYFLALSHILASAVNRIEKIFHDLWIEMGNKSKFHMVK